MVDLELPGSLTLDGWDWRQYGRQPQLLAAAQYAHLNTIPDARLAQEAAYIVDGHDRSLVECQDNISGAKTSTFSRATLCHLDDRNSARR